ncbi:predicted protein [Nematostella vectensis]|uniref:Uncharacterized protein n=3 Tax=Nematostella vectensis TaxID=45351 RepID=A7RNA0_NEMVE|nr:predicted protein [Nematostella vectensis]|eukprot:XP_001639091.1 predicted protein [Nematostella vectensis]
MTHNAMYQDLDSLAERRGGQEALVVYDMNKNRESMTYRQFKDRSMYIAASLLHLGVSRGNHVLLIGASGIRYAVFLMALHRIGAHVILLGPGGLTHDKVSLISGLELRAIVFGTFMQDSQIQQLQKGIGTLVHNADKIRASNLDSFKVDRNKKISHMANVGAFHATSYPIVISLGDKYPISNMSVLRYETLLQRGQEHSLLCELMTAQKRVQMDDPLVSLFTSGSTGLPKMVQHTVHSYANTIHSYLDSFEPLKNLGTCLNPFREIWYCDRPMAWAWGTLNVYQICLGVTVVWVPTEMALSESTNEAVFAILESESCTRGLLSVALIQKLSNNRLHLKYNLSSLQYVILGGQLYTKAITARLLDALPDITVRNSYGSTEGCQHAITTYTKDTISICDYGKMSVFPGVEAKVVDDEGKMVKRGVAGEMCVRSAWVFREYLGNPESTRRAKSLTGWYHTGDICQMDKDGRIEVLGRKKDFLKRATVKIFPAELERVFQEHPDVLDVAVVGVPDQRYTEELCACVILKSVNDDDTGARLKALEAWCEQQWPPSADGLSLKPRYFVQMEAFPLLNSGKEDRQGIRSIVMRRLGMTED